MLKVFQSQMSENKQISFFISFSPGWIRDWRRGYWPGSPTSNLGRGRPWKIELCGPAKKSQPLQTWDALHQNKPLSSPEWVDRRRKSPGLRTFRTWVAPRRVSSRPTGWTGRPEGGTWRTFGYFRLFGRSRYENGVKNRDSSGFAHFERYISVLRPSISPLMALLSSSVAFEVRFHGKKRWSSMEIWIFWNFRLLKVCRGCAICFDCSFRDFSVTARYFLILTNLIA